MMKNYGFSKSINVEYNKTHWWLEKWGDGSGGGNWNHISIKLIKEEDNSYQLNISKHCNNRSQANRAIKAAIRAFEKEFNKYRDGK